MKKNKKINITNQQESHLCKWITPFGRSYDFLISWLVVIVGIYLWSYTYLKSYFLYPINYLIDSIPNIFLFKLPALFYCIKSFTLALWFVIISLGLGVIILNKMKLKFDNIIEKILFSLALGLGLFGILMMVLALLRLWYTSFLFSLFALITPFIIYHIYKEFKMVTIKKARFDFYERIFLVIFVIVSAITLFISFSPDIFYDALVYHLSIPNYYSLHHGAVPMNTIIFSGFPVLIQMIYAPFLILNIEESTHVMNWFFANFTFLACIAFSIRFTKKLLGGLIGGLIFLSAISTMSLIFKGNVEIGWSFFQVIAIYAFVLIFEYKDKQKEKFILLAGALVGIVAGVKYQVWPFITTLPVILFLCSYKLRDLSLSKTQSLKIAFRHTLLFLGIACVFGMIWPIKNLILYYNPLYPFFPNIFTYGPYPYIEGFVGLAPKIGIKAILTTWRGFSAYILHPLNNVARVAEKDTNAIIGMFPLIGLLLILLVKVRDNSLKVLKTVILSAWFMWSISSTVTRYFLPTLPLIGLYLSVVLTSVFKQGFRRFLVISIVILSCFFNFKYYLVHAKPRNLDKVVLGSMTKFKYLSDLNFGYPYPNHDGIEFLNKNLSKDSKVLIVADPRTAYLNIDHLASTTWDNYPLYKWLQESSSVEELYAKYKENGITHQMINDFEFNRLQNLKRRLLLPLENEEKMEIYYEFGKKYLKQIFNKQDKNEKGQMIKSIRIYEITNY